MPNVTVEELNQLVTDLFNKRIEKEKLDEQLEEINAQVKRFEGKIIEYLDDLKLETFKGTAGTVTSYQKASYTVPKTPEEREKFFAYLKEKQIFDGMVTVNYNTLNGWAEKEFEAAKAEGNIFFSIPGLGAPTITKILSKTKAKK